MRNYIYFLAFLFFMIYFVLQPIAQYQAFLGNIPDVLRIFLVITFFIFTLILINKILNFRKIKISLFDVIITVFFLNMLMQILLDYFIYSHATILFDRNIIVLLYGIMFFLVGKFFYNIEKYYKYFLIAFVILVLEKLINFDISTFHIITKHITMGNKSEQTALYLYIGDTFAILSLLVLSFTYNNYLRIFILFTSIFTLFIISSRTALYIYLFVILIYIYKEFNVKSKIIILSLILIFIFGLLSFIGIDKLENMRMFAFLFSGEDSSVDERIFQINEGLSAINNYFLEGDYGGQYHKHEFGYYMHNILSFVRQFGSIALILMVFLFYYIAEYYLKFSKKYFNTHINYVFYISLFIFLESFISKSYVSPLIWFAFGMISNTKELTTQITKENLK